MSLASELVGRLRGGQSWSWVAPEFRETLPADLDARVMAWKSSDRLHEKQGRSTCRIHVPTATGRLAVYLKRHYRLSRRDGLAAVLHPEGRHSPAGAEWRHLAEAARLGLRVPEVVAAGERIGPWGRLQSYLMLRELTGQMELNESLPRIAASLPPREFADWKRAVVAEMARMVAVLHRAHAFHKDLYLCHFFVNASDVSRPGDRPTLIDLHRLGFHRRLSRWYRWKDLGQLLFSTVGVPGITTRDRLRFWASYRRAIGLPGIGLDRRAIVWRARRYLRHSRSNAVLD